MTANLLRNQRRFQEISKFCSLFKVLVIPRIWNGLASFSGGYHLFMKTYCKANKPYLNKNGEVFSCFRNCPERLF